MNDPNKKRGFSDNISNKLKDYAKSQSANIKTIDLKSFNIQLTKNKTNFKSETITKKLTTEHLEKFRTYKSNEFQINSFLHSNKSNNSSNNAFTRNPTVAFVPPPYFKTEQELSPVIARTQFKTAAAADVADPNQKTLLGKFREDLKKTQKLIDEEKAKCSSNLFKGKAIRLKTNPNESSNVKIINHTYTVKFFDPNSSTSNTHSTLNKKFSESQILNTISEVSPKSSSVVFKNKESFAGTIQGMHTPIASNKSLYQPFFKTEAVTIGQNDPSINTKLLNKTQSFFQFNKEKTLQKLKLSSNGNVSEFNEKIVLHEEVKIAKSNSNSNSKKDSYLRLSNSIPRSNYNTILSNKQIFTDNTGIFKTLHSPTKKNSQKNQLNLRQLTNNEHKYKNKPSPFSRVKSYVVTYLGNWHEKTNIPMPKISPYFISDSEYLYSAISDEMKILLDNFMYFKINYLNGLDILPAFKNMIRKSQTKFNKTMEETCGLLMEIPKLLLLDFIQYMNRFITIRPPSPSRFQTREVKNEVTNFNSNCNLLNYVGIYLKTSFEVYAILIKQVSDLNMNGVNYSKLTEFLARGRYNLSNLVMTAKNSIGNYRQDTDIIEKYAISGNANMPISNVTDSSKMVIITKKHLQQVDTNTISGNLREENSNNFIDSDLKQKKYFFKANEEAQRKRRLKSIFDNEKRADFSTENEENKTEKTDHKNPPRNSAINSEELSKLLKYCTKEIKEEILSQRIIDRYSRKEM